MADDRSQRRRQLGSRVGNVAFVLTLLACLVLAYYLSVRHAHYFDWTYRQRSSLSPTSRQLLERVQGDIEILAFTRNDPTLRRQIELLVNRYQRARAGVVLRFINPDLQPDLARQLGVRSDGDLVLEVAGQKERVAGLSEEAISDALRRAALGGHRPLVFMSGHGERALGDGNFELGRFADQLMRQGYGIEQWDPGQAGSPAADTTLLVLADPRTALPPIALERLIGYLEAGGNLLWLGDPSGPQQLGPLAESLGLSFLPGVVLDRSAAVAGFDNPQFAIARRLADHPTTRGLPGLVVLPTSSGLDAESANGWQVEPLLATVEHLSWTEVGPLDGDSAFQPNTSERPGPIALGLALARPLGERQQRVVVVGDTDFLANTYLGLGANLQLGLNLVTWLSGEDSQVRITPAAAPDTQLAMSERALSLLGLVSLLVVPLTLVATGTVTWWWRRR
jgi:ABC-type uncharacterized transport system involved in gliding motility auxiliary subunit